jgi:mono/diheme cytochrome c family protein
MRRWFAAAGVLSFFIAAGVSYSGDAPPDDWKAPGYAARKQNPVPASADVIAAGKVIYTSNCLACHGPAGKGDGPAAIAITPPPKDLSNPQIASQTDGELFWKVSQGKRPMPTYEKLLSETDRWTVIDYVRTLEPAASTQPATQPAGGQ